MKITAIIPARYASVRFPGKALADIDGKPMIQHVYEQTLRATLVNNVIVATDDERICQAVQAFGGACRMTSQTHETGTDRLAEVAAGIEADIIVNVQGDEPLIEPEMIDQAIRPFLDDPALRMGTLKTRIRCLHDFLSPNVVKVVTDLKGYAVYFSRSPSPFSGISGRISKMILLPPVNCSASSTSDCMSTGATFLIEFAAMHPTFLEVSEKLEQLRAVENGIAIRVVETEFESIGVDTPDDLVKARERFKSLKS